MDGLVLADGLDSRVAYFPVASILDNPEVSSLEVNTLDNILDSRAVSILDNPEASILDNPEANIPDNPEASIPDSQAVSIPASRILGSLLDPRLRDRHQVPLTRETESWLETE